MLHRKGCEDVDNVYLRAAVNQLKSFGPDWMRNFLPALPVRDIRIPQA